MFKNLIQFWKGKDFLKQVLEEFTNMLEDSHSMYKSVCETLIYGRKEEGLEQKIYDIDKKVNELERDIRKRIVEHLTLQPSIDVPTCLLLMSVVKDAERLGDYSKNLFGVSKLLAKPIDREKYAGLFDNIEKEISGLFESAKKAFIESNQETALSSWKYERVIVKKCDEIIKILSAGNFSVNEAVCFTLMARYFKRLTAHLTNIATSVIVPLTDLDYFDEKRKSDKSF
jgi:phosphate transport system protein